MLCMLLSTLFGGGLNRLRDNTVDAEHNQSLAFRA
jgi:hypothetical protein